MLDFCPIRLSRQQFQSSTPRDNHFTSPDLAEYQGHQYHSLHLNHAVGNTPRDAPILARFPPYHGTRQRLEMSAWPLLVRGSLRDGGRHVLQDP